MKQCFKASNRQMKTTQISYRMQRIIAHVSNPAAFAPRNQRVSVGISAVGVGNRRGRVPVFSHVASATPAYQIWLKRQGPPWVTAVDGDGHQPACRLWGRRQVLAGFGPGGKRHVSPTQTCHHRDVVLFDNFFGRWSFLTIHSHMWFFS
jgi:hypothetical protein